VVEETGDFAANPEVADVEGRCKVDGRGGKDYSRYFLLMKDYNS